MKSVIIILLAVVLIVPFSAFAQESLSELGDRLDEENLEKAEDAGSIIEPFGSNIQQETIEEVIGEPDDTDSTNNQLILVFLIIGLIISGFIILKKRRSSSKVSSSDERS